VIGNWEDWTVGDWFIVILIGLGKAVMLISLGYLVAAALGLV